MMKRKAFSVMLILSILMVLFSNFIVNVSAEENWWMPLLSYSIVGDGFNCTCSVHNGNHNGQDFPAPSGTSVRATKSGTVVACYSSCTASHYYGDGSCQNGSSCGSKSMGNYVQIRHSDGSQSIYMHLSVVSVSYGSVVQGQEIGKVGSTGRSTGSHLHFGIQNSSGSYVNPMNYVDVNNPSPGEPQPVDLGTGFYTYIFNQPSWKTVAWDPNSSNVFLESEKWTANQRWFATRNDDGSYTFKNAKNNKCLDVANSGTVNLTNVQVVDPSGGDAQRWFIYSEGGNYVLSPKCSPGMVLDLYNGDTAEHTNVCIYNKNGENGQIYTLYKVEAEAGRPQITANAEYINNDGTTIVYWDATEYTDHYRYYLTEYPTGYAYNTYTRAGDVYGTSVAFSNLTSGKYTCFIHAVSHQGNWGAQSNWVSFKVYEKDYVPKKIVANNNHIYALYDYEMSWTFARDLCAQLGGHLVTVTSAEEEKLIEDLINSGSKAAYWLGATDITEFSTTTFNEKVYTWITGEQFSYSNWASGEPNASGENGEKEHFAEIRKSYGSKWNDVNNINKSNKGFILEIEMDDYSPIAIEGYNGHTYMLFDKNTTWSEAKVFCEQLGGHLATADSNAENDFLKSFIKNGERAWYYIGGQKQNGTWKWLDGNSVSNVQWTSWAESWPGTNLMMYETTGNCTGLYNAYFPEDIKYIGFVCEIDNYYMLPPHTETQVVKNGNTYNISVSQTNLETAKIIVAGYKSNKISDMKILNNDNLQTTFTGDFDTFKVMAWENLSTLKPLCEAETIPQNKWIIE